LQMLYEIPNQYNPVEAPMTTSYFKC